MAAVTATASIPTSPALTPAEAGRGRFVWPVRGEVISSFGPKGPGQSKDGLNIAAREGDPVLAAASGEVVYAGDQVAPFGKLVLIKHDGGWVTAYAHLSEISVKMKDRVSQSGVIGKAGRTGAVPTPQLYFEVRYAPSAKDKARPVDPMPLLPQ
jgi:murein DD-endopeptidase MepM/ murein hydrolase activator NlpD